MTAHGSGDDARAREWGAALDALLDPRPDTVLAGTAAAEASGWTEAQVRIVPDRQLGSALRGSTARVVAVHEPSMTVLRALQGHPVPLVVLTGAADVVSDEAVAGLRAAGSRVLGPGARIRYGAGRAIVCAPDSGELEGLWRSLGGAALGVSPTPGWWWQLLLREAVRDRPVAGYVPAAVLDEGWAAWALEQGPAPVLVPLGVPSPPLDDPEHPALAAAMAAHALERWTGPVFPSPRVVASVLRGLRGLAAPTESSTPDPGIWQQARRALPMTGAVVGMERARDDLATDVATAAFLAQRALLRVDAAQRALEVEFDEPEPVDPEGIERSGEVLRSAGEVLTDHESKVVLRGFGIEVTRQAVASSASGAAGFADRIGFPVALKALSPDLRRRADIGALRLSLRTAAAVRRAYAAVVDAVERNAPTARLDGVLVAEMVRPGLDVQVGVVRLPRGTLALYGRCVDASAPIEPILAPAPLARDDALMLAHAILGRMPVPALRRASDPDGRDLATVLLRLSAVCEHHAERLELVELRPVRLLHAEGDEDERGYVTLGARIVQRPHLQGR